MADDGSVKWTEPQQGKGTYQEGYAAALEEAARVCDSLRQNATQAKEKGLLGRREEDDIWTVLSSAAERIRALATDHEAGQ